MNKQIIDKSKVIIRDPEMYLCGSPCNNKQQFYKKIGTIATICGVIGFILFIAMISYFMNN